MGRKVLVADDSVTIQKVIKLALSSEGYDILAVSEGKEAIRAIHEEKPDVVLIDVALPLADAYAVKRVINEDPALSHIGFVLMASAFEKVDEKSNDEAGFDGRLIKPFDPSHLRKAVSDLMKRTSDGKAPPVAKPRAPSNPSKGLESRVSQSLGSNAPSIPAPPQDSQIQLESPIELIPTQKEESKVTISLEQDLPPVTDMHPTIEEHAQQEAVSESEFQLPPPPTMHGGDEEEAEAEVAAEQALENDIKDLTESTIKMSGLDEFQWNLDDSKKMKGPDAEKTREVTRPISIDSKKTPSLKTAIGAPNRVVDDGGSNFPLREASKEKPATPPSGSNLVSGRDYVASTLDLNADSKSAATSGISRAEMEQIIRKDLEDVLEKMVREMVPQIAEKLIRKEIEKILSEP